MFSSLKQFHIDMYREHLESASFIHDQRQASRNRLAGDDGSGVAVPVFADLDAGCRQPLGGIELGRHRVDFERHCIRAQAAHFAADAKRIEALGRRQPHFGEHRRDLLDDLAVLTGSMLLDGRHYGERLFLLTNTFY